MKTQTCECADRGCPVHRGQSTCDKRSARLLFRVDMVDRTGTLFCNACAADAWDSGLFDTRVPGQAR